MLPHEKANDVYSHLHVVVEEIKALGLKNKIDNIEIMRKLLRILSPSYNSIVMCLFQANLATLFVGAMLGKLTAYEGYMLGTFTDTQLLKNFALQVEESPNEKNEKKKVKEDEDDENDNEDLALLIKKIFRKRIPSSSKRNFGCFNCGKKGRKTILLRSVIS